MASILRLVRHNIESRCPILIIPAPVWQGETSKASWRGKLIVIEMIMNIAGFSLSNWVTYGFSYASSSCIELEVSTDVSQIRGWKRFMACPFGLPILVHHRSLRHCPMAARIT